MAKLLAPKAPDFLWSLGGETRGGGGWRGCLSQGLRQSGVVRKSRGPCRAGEQPGAGAGGTGSAPLHGRRDEAALPPLPPWAHRQLFPDRRQQDPQAVLGAAGHPGDPGPARGPRAAGQRRPGRPGRGDGDAGREGRDGPSWTPRPPRGGGQPRRGRRARREGGAGRVRRGPPLGLQRQALRVAQPAAGRPAHPLRRGAHQRAGPLRPGHGQVHLRGARPLLLRRPRHRLPRQPPVRHHEERPVRGLLLPVLRELAQAHLPLGGHPGPPGARGRGVGAGGRRGLHRLLRQRQDGQHLHRLPRVLLLAKLRRLRLSLPAAAPGARAPSPAPCPRRPALAIPRQGSGSRDARGRCPGPAWPPRQRQTHGPSAAPEAAGDDPSSSAASERSIISGAGRRAETPALGSPNNPVVTYYSPQPPRPAAAPAVPAGAPARAASFPACPPRRAGCPRPPARCGTARSQRPPAPWGWLPALRPPP